MSALSIRAKVIAVIAFMLIAMSGMGLLAIRTIQGVNAHTVEIASGWLPSVRVLGELRTDINLFRIALRAHVMAETLEAKAANDKRLAGILERIAKDRKTYELLINSAEERAIYQNWSAAWDKYIAGVQGVIVLSRQSIGRIPTEASDAISNQSVTGIVTSTPGTYAIRFALTAKAADSPRQHDLNQSVAVVVK
jgi:methyl-accepting chemotaxis protein